MIAPEWQKRIDEAQRITHTVIGGTAYQRIPSTVPCHDCGVDPGQLHVPTCCVERCPRCHGQAIACPCSDDAAPAMVH